MVLAARNGQAMQRNAFEAEALLAEWRRLYPNCRFETLVLAPDPVSEDAEPLSWRLAPSQRRAIAEGWWEPLRRAKHWLRSFLHGPEDAPHGSDR